MMRKAIFLLLIFLTACTPAPAILDVPPQIVSVYATTASAEWLPVFYDCADRSQGVLVSRSFDISSADISLRIGEPARLTAFAYPIGETTLAVVASADNPVTALSETQVAALFSGRIRNWTEVGGEDADVQVWSYGSGEDVQVAFDGAMLGGGNITSNARQAQSPEAMRDAVSNNPLAIGILPLAEFDENLSLLYSIETFPVLAMLIEEPQGALLNLLLCAQK